VHWLLVHWLLVHWLYAPAGVWHGRNCRATYECRLPVRVWEQCCDNIG